MNSSLKLKAVSTTVATRVHSAVSDSGVGGNRVKKQNKIFHFR